jgi:membrane-associated phospholipid phosphatase
VSVRVARRRGPRGAAATLTIAALTASSPGRSQALRYDPAVDWAVTLGGAGALVTTDGLQSELVPTRCRWCDRDDAGHDGLNGLDRAVRRLRWSRPRLADTASDVAAFVVVPSVALGSLALAVAHDGRTRELGPDALVTGEAGVLAADLNQLAKVLVLRERPDVHALTTSDPSSPVTSVDANLSFYSGHTSEAVSLAVAAGTVASLTAERWAPLVWGTSLPLAFLTGYLRIAADRHYFTDVLTGAVVGAAVGFIVPYLHRPDGMQEGGSLAGQVCAMKLSGLW